MVTKEAIVCASCRCHVLLCLLQIEMLDGGFDVLVATPGRLLAHHERGSLNLSNTAALVMDEVDVLAGMATEPVHIVLRLCHVLSYALP